MKRMYQLDTFSFFVSFHIKMMGPNILTLVSF